MASVNPLSRELVFKVVYYGPGLGGKTTTLEHIHATAKPDHRGKLVSLATPVDRTLYFDFLPMRLPPIRGMHVRLQLFTVPGQVYFNATRKLVLTGADGIVFVADSQTARADANLESLDNLRDNLADQGRNLNDVPIVFQYNKYDLADVLSVAELDKLLNRSNAPSLATSARTGLGVYEGLEKITHAVLASFETQMPESVRVAAAAAYDPHEEGLAAALRGASQGEDRPPTSGAIFNRVASSRVALGSIPPETGSEEAPPIDKAAMRAAALPVTTFPDAPDDGWGSKEKLAIAPATDASILTRHEGARSHSSRGPDSRSGESPRSRNRPSVLPPKPFAPLIPQAGPPRTHAPAAPPNATTSAPKEAAPLHQAHAPSPPANATVAATPTKITPGADRAPSTEKTIALQVKPPTSPKPEAAKIEVVQPKPEPAKIAVAPAKPEPPKHEPLKLDVAPVKPEPPKVEPPKVEAAFAPPKPEPPKVEVAPAKPEPPKVEAAFAPPKPEPPKHEPPKVEAAFAPPKPEPPKHEPLKLDVAPFKPEPPKHEPAKVEVAPAKPEPPKHEPEPAKVDVAPAKPEPPKHEPEPAKVEVAPAKPEPAKAELEPAKVDVAPAKPEPPKHELEPAKVDVAPAKPESPKHEPEPAKVDVAPAKPERLDPTMLFSIADLLEPPVETTLEVPQPPQSSAQRALETLQTTTDKPISTRTVSERVPLVPSSAPGSRSAKGNVPSAPPPPPTRPIGALATLAEARTSEPSSQPAASSRETFETNFLAKAVASDRPDSRKTGLSFADLWPEADRSLVYDVEAAIAAGKLAEAIDLSDSLVTRVLTSTATLFGSTDVARDASNMPYLLGIDGRRYLAFRSIVRAARSGAKVSMQDALGAYAFALEARMAKSSVR